MTEWLRDNIYFEMKMGIRNNFFGTFAYTLLLYNL